MLVKVINFKQNVTVCTLHSGMDLMFCMSVMGVDMEVCMCEEILFCDQRLLVANLML